ncbi:MAG: hypothetical protein EP330_19260 [Deltaproteobacteria bacterium]|nr:MAG: hypothetical protein EP330_19260 [Deltaproteobacteria bacterium]
MRLLPLALAALTACTGPIMDDVEWVDTGMDQACWQSNQASGLGRLLAGGDVQVVLSPVRPAAYQFGSAALASGGTLVDESVTEEQAVFVVSPDAPTTPLVFVAQLECHNDNWDTGSPEWRYEVHPAELTDAWSSLAVQ